MMQVANLNRSIIDVRKEALLYYSDRGKPSAAQKDAEAALATHKPEQELGNHTLALVDDKQTGGELGASLPARKITVNIERVQGNSHVFALLLSLLVSSPNPLAQPYNRTRYVGQDKDTEEEILDTAALTLDLNKYAKLVEHLVCSDMPGATSLFSMHAFFPRLHLQDYEGGPLTGLARMTSWWCNSPGDHKSLKGTSCKIGWVHLGEESNQLPWICLASVRSVSLLVRPHYFRLGFSLAPILAKICCICLKSDNSFGWFMW